MATRKPASKTCQKAPEDYQVLYLEQLRRAAQLSDELAKARATIDAQATVLALKRGSRIFDDIPF